MSGNNNNMTVAMPAASGRGTRENASHFGKTVNTKEEDVTERGWYDRINDFQLEDKDIPVETIQEIEEDSAPCKTKIAALIKIIGKKNRDGFEREKALTRETTTSESLTLHTEAQMERIAHLEEEKDQQKKDYDEMKKSVEDFKRHLAAKEKFLQTAENSNRRLSEDLTDKINTLGNTGKDKKSLTRLAHGQKKEIASLEEMVGHLKKEMATKGRLVEKYERERLEWVKELVERKGPLFQENKELTARVEFLEGELSSALQESRMDLSSSLKTFNSTRGPTPGKEPSILADEMKGEESGRESGEEWGMWKGEKGEKVGKIDFQPPGWDRLSAMSTIGDMAKGKPNPDRPTSLHQPSSPSSSTFWSEGVATENGFAIPKALSSVPADEKVQVVTGRLNAGVQTEAAGLTVSSSAQTVSLEVREASVQTEDWKSGPSEDGMKAPVQTRKNAVALDAEWQRWLSVVMMMLLCATVFYSWGSEMERGRWYEANGVPQGIIVELRNLALGNIPLLQKVRYSLITWLEPDRGFFG